MVSRMAQKPMLIAAVQHASLASLVLIQISALVARYVVRVEVVFLLPVQETVNVVRGKSARVACVWRSKHVLVFPVRRTKLASQDTALLHQSPHVQQMHNAALENIAVQQFIAAFQIPERAIPAVRVLPATLANSAMQQPTYAYLLAAVQNHLRDRARQTLIAKQALRSVIPL